LERFEDIFFGGHSGTSDQLCEIIRQLIKAFVKVGIIEMEHDLAIDKHITRRHNNEQESADKRLYRQVMNRHPHLRL